MIFGTQKDFDLIRGIIREMVQDVSEQEILYYKFSLADTEANIYGEASTKTFFDPVKLNCLITRGDQEVATDDLGPDLSRNASFAFIRQDLVDVNVVPEVGDVVLWHEDFYLVDTVKENQLFFGKDNSYNLVNYGNKYGSSVSIIVDCHLTRADTLGIKEIR